MPSVAGYGYQPTLKVYSSDLGNDIIGIYIASDSEIPAGVGYPNAISDMYYVCSDYESHMFMINNYLSSMNSETKYKYAITENTNDNKMELSLYDDNVALVETIGLSIDNDNGNLDYHNYNIVIRCDYADIDNPAITQVGFACSCDGVGDIGPIHRNYVVWFTDTQALDIIKDCILINKVGEGVVTTKLKNSNDFLITKLPDDFYSKNSYSSFDHILLNDIIPFGDDPDTLLLDSACCYNIPTNPLGNISYLADCAYIGMYNIHLGFITKYGNDVGSDLCRKTADGQYTNAGTLAQYQDLIIKGISTGGSASDAYDIEFEGGILRWTVNSQSLLWILHLCDADGNSVDSWTLPTTISPSTGNPGAGQNNPGIATAFLCKSGSNYYIVGEIRDGHIYDADGNILYDSFYATSMCYVILKKFNSSANQILNNATETIVEFDKTSVDDNTEVGSTPQNANDLDDRTSVWDSGEHQGENTGIRHNGSEIIDASNGELTGDHPVGEISTPKESGEGRIPTPLNTGTITAFAPTVDELKDFFRVCNQQSVLETFANLFQQPLEKVVSCHTCIAPALTSGTRSYLTFGAWSSSSYGDLSMLTLEQQYYSCYMGSITLEEKRNSYKDYPPFCNYKIYLPYIGVRDIDGRIVVGKKLALWYHIDVLTGDILAELKVGNMNSQITSSFYCWQGNTLVPMPLKSTDYSSVISNSIGTILSTGTAIASGVANSARTVQGFTETAKTLSDSFFPDIRSIGTVQGSMTYCMYPYPYIIKEYPYLSETNPYQYKRLIGLPSNIGNRLIDNIVDNSPQFIKFYAQDLNLIHTNKKSLFATESEKKEIETLLAEGVYI